MENELQSSAIKNSERKFDGTDTEKTFNRNLRTQEKNWIYRDKLITYRYNEHGFRNKSFTEVDWANAIVVTGCSNVFGIGVALEDTMCWHLEKMLNTPVVNLGVPASAVDFACWNSLILHNNYPRPKGIVHVWSSPDRYTDYNKTLLPFTSHHPKYFGRLNWTYRSTRYIESDRALWKDKTQYVEASFFCMDYDDDAHINMLYTLDKARDLSHPGIQTHFSAAEKIAEQLTQK